MSALYVSVTLTIIQRHPDRFGLTFCVWEPYAGHATIKTVDALMYGLLGTAPVRHHFADDKGRIPAAFPLHVGASGPVYQEGIPFIQPSNQDGEIRARAKAAILALYPDASLTDGESPSTFSGTTPALDAINAKLALAYSAALGLATFREAAV